jgi:adenosine deaminase
VRIAAFLRALPKAELHLHIEGAVPWALVRAASAGALPERPEWWADGFRFPSFDRFREAARVIVASFLTSADRYGAGAAAIFAGLRAQNVRYVELSFDAELVARRALPFDEVVAAIRGAAPPGLAVRVIGALSYHKREHTTPALVEALLAARGLDGLDLHGDGSLGGAAYFAGAFAEARRAGLLTKAHAGELAGPESVREALDALGVRRIEHGVRAVEDETLLGRLAAEAITLDVCPWSNVRLGVTPDLATHPIKRLHARGVRVTASTDDPTIFGQTLTEELARLTEALGFSAQDLARLQENAFAVARLTAVERARALDEIRALVAASEGART